MRFLKYILLTTTTVIALFFGLQQMVFAQTLEVIAETAQFTEYELRNDSLRIDHPFELMVATGGSQSFEVLSQRIVTVSRNDLNTVTHEALALSSVDEPFIQILNPGMFRGREVSSLRIHVARFNEREPGTYQITHSARIRVYKENNVMARVSAASFAAQPSPFNTGTWYKIPISKSGIYEIDAAYLEELGINTSAINPRNIQIWSTPGYELPRLNSAQRPILTQIPIIVQGEGNNQFNSGDKILFYGHSHHQIIRNTQGLYSHQLHRYSDSNYVFLTVANQSGMRLQEATVTQNPVRTVNTFRDFLWKETDLYKSEERIRSGLDWYGQRFSSTANLRQQEILKDTIPGFIQGQLVNISIQVMGRSTQPMSLSFSSGNTNLGSISISSIQNYNDDVGISGRTAVFRTQSQVQSANDIITLAAQMSFSEVNTEGFIDWIRLSFDRNLTAHNNRLLFYPPADGSVTEIATYNMTGFSDAPLLLDTTKPMAPVRILTTTIGTNFQFRYNTDPENRFTAQTDFFKPGKGEVIESQNLRGLSNYPQYVIVTAELFLDQAQEWADYRSQQDGFETVVVTQNQIFNEFSGGVPDVTAIRDYMKFLYDRAALAGQNMPEHLLLFGEATFDFRGIQNSTLTNYVFTFQSDESLHRINSYGSDDYFGLLDDNEGVWAPFTSTERLDIGIGRFPVQNRDEARVIMDKIRRYESPETLGDWRNRFSFSADDDFPEVETNRDLHLLNADGTAIQIEKNNTATRIDKVYMLSYPVETTASGRRVPQATNDFIDSFNSGSLVINYSGHGGQTVLADERLFTVDMIPLLTNRDKLPIFVTATCQFGRYDDNEAKSGAERTLLWENGGTVAAFTTTRVVFTSSTAGSNNFGLNIQLTRQMVEREANGKPQRLGDIYRRTKNTSQGSGFNARKFILLGDPAMRIGLPDNRAEITEINNVDLELDADTTLQIRALDMVEMKGRVTDQSGQFLSSFTGEVNITIFDAERSVPLPPKNWVIEERCFQPNCEYDVETDVLFNGRASVQNGMFNASFIVPKDISFSPDNGRILIYSRGAGIDGSGSFNRINFYGINPDAPEDNEGPELDVYLNDQNFVNGNLVGNSPTLIVELSDDSGINTTGIGVGHEIIATIDTQPRKTIVLNDFFTGNLDDFKSGRIEYPLQNLPEGSYTLTVRAWDVHNNPSEKNIFFDVADNERLLIRNAYNYPNPMNNITRFVFEHNQPGTLLDIDVRIFTLSGAPVMQLQETQITTNSYAYIEWNGRDRDYDRLANGTYIYVLRIRADTPQGRQTEEKIEKLVIIR